MTALQWSLCDAQLKGNLAPPTHSDVYQLGGTCTILQKGIAYSAKKGTQRGRVLIATGR